MYKKITQAVAVAALLGGCSTITPTPNTTIEQKSMFIVMKLPAFKFADQGFVDRSNGSTKIEIYSSGTPVMKIEITGSQVCSGSGLFSCMSKSAFNSRFLSANYPDDTLEHIVTSEPIFDSEGMQGGGDSFTQTISKDGAYNISYSASSGSSEFIDSTNDIVIKVRDN